MREGSRTRKYKPIKKKRGAREKEERDREGESDLMACVLGLGGGRWS